MKECTKYLKDMSVDPDQLDDIKQELDDQNQAQEHRNQIFKDLANTDQNDKEFEKYCQETM